MGLISRVSSRTYRNAYFVKNNNNNKMVSVKDVNQADFVTAFAAFLKKSGKMTPPKWSDFAKTATFKQMPPADDDWFYIRVAAVARQLYIKGTVGTGRMSVIYGGSANRGFRPCHTKRGNGHIARIAFQELEKLKMVEKADKGRKLSKQGQQDMDRVASQLVKASSE